MASATFSSGGGNSYSSTVSTSVDGLGTRSTTYTIPANKMGRLTVVYKFRDYSLNTLSSSTTDARVFLGSTENNVTNYLFKNKPGNLSTAYPAGIFKVDYPELFIDAGTVISLIIGNDTGAQDLLTIHVTLFDK